MPRKPSINSVAITINVPQAILDDAEMAAKEYPDHELANVTRTDILRIAMRRGLDVILAQRRKHLEPLQSQAQRKTKTT